MSYAKSKSSGEPALVSTLSDRALSVRPYMHSSSLIRIITGHIVDCQKYKVSSYGKQ